MWIYACFCNHDDNNLWWDHLAFVIIRCVRLPQQGHKTMSTFSTLLSTSSSKLSSTLSSTLLSKLLSTSSSTLSSTLCQQYVNIMVNLVINTVVKIVSNFQQFSVIANIVTIASQHCQHLFHWVHLLYQFLIYLRETIIYVCVHVYLMSATSVSWKSQFRSEILLSQDCLSSGISSSCSVRQRSN